MIPKLFFLSQRHFYRSNIFIYCICSCPIVWAQSNRGAALTAMGTNGAIASGIWSANANPAGICNVIQPSVAFSYSTVMSLPELSSQAGIFIFPAKKNKFGLTIDRYGFSAFNELSTGFVYGKQFGNKLSVAAKFNYHQINAADYGFVSSFSFDLGLMYVFGDKVVLGAYISNPTRQQYPSNHINFPIASFYAAGLSWQTSDQVLLAGSLEKAYGHPADFKTGLAYDLTDFSLRAGLSLKPLKHYAGFGIRRKSFTMDFAIISDVHLGYQPQISIGYAW